MEILHLENIENKGYTVCGELINDDNISFNETLCTCTKCLNKLIYVDFGNICRKELGLQCQYGSRYVDGKISGWKNLGNGLRFKGNTNQYYSLKIHKDDVIEFVNRYNKHIQESIQV